MTEQDINTILKPHPTGPNFKDLTGRKFHFLTILGFAGLGRSGRSTWLCQCDCGVRTVKGIDFLNQRIAPSCGCDTVAQRQGRNRKHGHFGTPIYNIWLSMLARCGNPNSKAYYNYGGRGIKVCGRWRKFENFLNDMGERPSPQYSIDRIDNDGDYCPENCRWATIDVQSNNKRTNHFLTFNGKTQTVRQWSRELLIGHTTLHFRIANGWTVERTLTTPPRKLR